MAFEIEDRIPLPPKSSSKIKYPLAEMKVGQSFFAPGVKSSAISGRAATVAKASGDGRKYATRVVDGGVRVWRVE